MQFIARFVFGIFGVIGVTIMYSLWFGFVDGFGEPPVFFKIFGSLIASVFCVVGFRVALFGPQGLQKETQRHGTEAPRRPQREGSDGYTCPHCQGGLKSQSSVSPGGDVKCAFCDRWFNIHGAI